QTRTSNRRIASALGRMAGRLPGDDPARKMRVIAQARRLRGLRGRHRALARAAGEHDLPALRIGNFCRIEARHRHEHRTREGLDRSLARLAHVDEQDAILLHPARDFVDREIAHRLAFAEHGFHSLPGYLATESLVLEATPHLDPAPAMWAAHALRSSFCGGAQRVK